MCRSTHTACQHETMAHHDRETIQILLDSQTLRIQETERREQELQDRVVAMELAPMPVIYLLVQAHPM
jgi:hypothetical protein